MLYHHARRVLDEHSAAGRAFAAADVVSFVREQGTGPAIVLLHGIPVSSLLYRKMVGPLASRGFRALAFDLPGTGFADRPLDFDYSLEGLASFVGEALAALDCAPCHLVVHDIGGPIGCTWACRHPDQVLSLTVLNTTLNLASYDDPWSLEMLKRPKLGAIAMGLMNGLSFASLMYRSGIGQRSAVPLSDVLAHYLLLKRRDGGQAFLELNRSWQDGRKEPWLREQLAKRPFPAQVVWGRNDPVLRDGHRQVVLDMLGLETSVLLPAKHFPQEDHAGQLVDAISTFAELHTNGGIQ